VPVASFAAGLVREARTIASQPPPGSATIPVRLNVNGQERQLRLDPRTSLLDALREEMALSGTKKGCDHGQCGACTVLVDGRRVLSCLTLAAMASGHRVTTVEGLAQGDRLHPVQAAFLKHDAFQCGYCTPGQIVSAVGLLTEGCPDDPADIRECMSGNLCRCGAYPNIVDAVREAKRGRAS
jgi:xanthine dehydrogenase YagT iron-sulfur-binding subunit